MPPVEELLQENAQLKSELSGKDERIAELEAQIAWFRRQIFAGGKSEKVDPGQLDLLLKGLEEAKVEEAKAKKAPCDRGPAKPRRGREELYGNLPVLEVSVIEPEEVQADPEGYERIGEEETFEVKVDPPRFYRKLVARLYKVEAEIRERSLPPSEAKALRKEKSANTHARIKRVLTILRHQCLPKSELGKACDYSLGHWRQLSTYLEHGRVEIDNNAMENAIRPTAIGKKNWLFVGHPQVGERAAILYSILISCQRLDVHPQDYLAEMLKTDLSRLDCKQLSELTPSAWAKSKGSAWTPLFSPVLMRDSRMGFRG